MRPALRVHAATKRAHRLGVPCFGLCYYSMCASEPSLSLSREYNMSRERVLRDIKRGAVSLLYISFMISHFLDISSSHFT